MQKSNFRPYGRTMLRVSALFLTIILCFSSCKQEADKDSKPVSSAKTKATISTSLPGGKQYFSTSIGRFASRATGGAIWVRNLNLTFTTAGTVDGYYWQWDSVAEKGKTAFSTHTCSLGGSNPRTCTIYTPTGWITPGSQWVYISGTYTYNAGALHIDWLGPHAGDSENWTVTNPISTIARLSFVSSAGTGYQITHGTGYGSNAPFSVYKTITQIPRVKYTGKYIYYNYNTTLAVKEDFIPDNGASGTWQPFALDLSTSSYPSNPATLTSLHFYTPGYDPECSTGGHIYHLGGANNSRSMAYNHYRACLAVQQTTFPCYNLRMHPYALNQIIDDGGNFKGFIGIEQQDEPGSTAGWEYQLVDYTLIPQ